MRIENEMLSRFSTSESLNVELAEKSLSKELDFFFNNIMGTVVDYFTEEQTLEV